MSQGYAKGEFAILTGPAGGDLSGAYPTPIVIAIRGNPIEAQTLGIAQDGYVLTWKNSDGYWEASPAAISFTAGGDLSGSNVDQTVIGIRNTPIIISGLVSGNTLSYNGTSWVNGPLNLAGGGTVVSGILPIVNQADQTMGGDVSGTTNAAVVIKLQSNPVAAGILTSAQDGYTLTWTGTQWQADPITFAGDISGTNLASSVIKIQGIAISTTPPTSNQVLEYNSGISQWAPANLPSSLPPSGIAGGDLSGSYPNPTVAKIQGNPVKPQALGVVQDGYVLTWKNSDGYWEAKPTATQFVAGGDLAGTSTNQIVIGLDTVPLNITSLTSGNALTYNGSNWINGPINLAGGSPAVSGVLPAGNLPVATTGALGIIQLTGDLGGTDTSPSVLAIHGTTVPSSPSATQILVATSSSSATWQNPTSIGAVTWANDLSGSTSTNQYVAAISGNAGAGGTIPINATDLQFGTSQTNPVINQANKTTNGGVANNLTLQAQTETGAASTGGNLYLMSGTGTSADGYVQLQHGSTPGLTLQATGVVTVANLGTGVVHSDGSGDLTSSSIVNADVSVSAAISGSKITPNFGSQNISTTGILSAGNTTVTSLQDTAFSLAGVVHNDSSGNFSSSSIVNADVSPSAAVQVSKLAPGVAAQILLNNSTPTPTWTTVSGDVALSSSGVTDIGSITGSGGVVSVLATIQGSSSGGGNAVQYGIANVAMTSDANYTLTAAQLSQYYLRITSNVSLTSTRQIILPDGYGASYSVYNHTTGGQSLTFIGAVGSGVTVPNGIKTIIYFDGTNYVPGSAIIGGDLFASNNISQTVVALQSNPVASGTLTSLQDGYALTWTGTAWTAEPIPSSFTAGGDLSGSSTSQTVVGLDNRPLVITSLNAGNQIIYNGTNWINSALNLAGGSNYVTGLLPTTNQVAQNLTLTGDVTSSGGTTASASTIVASIQGVVISGTPSSGQVLKATSPTAASWATDPATVTWANDLSTSTNTNQYVSSITGSGGLISIMATMQGSTTGSGNGLQFGISNIIMSSDANLTLSAAQLSQYYLRFTSSVNLTATRSIILPTVMGTTYSINNHTSGGQSLLFIGSTGTGTTVPNGLKADIYFDGTNYVTASVIIGGDLSATTNLAQTVSGIDGYSISTFSSGQVLEYNGTHWVGVTPSSFVTWTNDLSSSSSTNQWVSGISGASGNAGSITLGNSSSNLSLTQITSGQTTPPTLSIASSAGYSPISSNGGAGGLLTISGGVGGAGTGATSTGGNGAGVNLTAGSGGVATGTSNNSNGGSIKFITGSAGTGGSGTAGQIGEFALALGTTNELVIDSGITTGGTVTLLTGDGYSSIAWISPNSIQLAPPNLSFTTAAGYAAGSISGAGGVFNITSGNGTKATSGYINVAGAGGAINITAGTGASGSGSNPAPPHQQGTGGFGGNVTISSGSGGPISGPNPAGTAGNIYLDIGATNYLSLTSTTATLNVANSGGTIALEINSTTYLGIASTGAVTLANLGTGVVQSSSVGLLSSAPLNLGGGASYITGVLPVNNVATSLWDLETDTNSVVGWANSVTTPTISQATPAPSSTPPAGAALTIKAQAGGGALSGNTNGGNGGNIVITPGTGGGPSGTGVTGSPGTVTITGLTAGLVQSSSGGVLSTVANGTANQVLTMVSGTPTWRGPLYAMLYGGTPLTTLTTAGTYYEFGTGTGGVAWTSNGSNLTTSATGFSIPNIAADDGYYCVAFSVSFELAAADRLTFRIYQNGAQAGNASFAANASSAAEPAAVSGQIVVNANANDTFALYVTASANTLTPTWLYSTFSAFLI